MRARAHVAVIGAGAFGGWSALHLLRMGAGVTLVDRWGAGNARSSSGGETRIIRATYGPDRIYSELVLRSFPQWDELHAKTPDALYVETGVLWMNSRSDDAYARASKPILEELGFRFDRLTMDDAARRYPQICFDDMHSVWLEPRAGVLSAKRACESLREELRLLGAKITITGARVTAEECGLAVLLDDGTRLEADAYLFACGPWLPALFPEVVGTSIRPTRQEVFYFGTPGGGEYRPGRLPSWIEFGERILYGTPDTHGRGLKVADDTRGAAFDPTTGDRSPSRDGIERARAFVSRRFPALANAPLIASEVCQYENSLDGHLIFDRHPGAANVWLLGGGSGHGFKLAPAVGEIAASSILSGAEPPAPFRLDRLGSVERPVTQFESRAAKR